MGAMLVLDDYHGDESWFDKNFNVSGIAGVPGRRWWLVYQPLGTLCILFSYHIKKSPRLVYIIMFTLVIIICLIDDLNSEWPYVTGRKSGVNGTL